MVIGFSMDLAKYIHYNTESRAMLDRIRHAGYECLLSSAPPPCDSS